MKFIYLLLIGCLISSAYADTLTGRVVSVADGDTIRVLDDTKTEHRVRLYGIDAPEKAQDGGHWDRKTGTYHKHGSSKR